MKYEGKIKLTQDEKKYIQKILFTEPNDESECFGEDEVIDHEYKFENGNFMAIQVCGVQYDEDNCNLPWTQAVLFAEDGSELCYTDVGEFYLGEWEIEYDGDIYSVWIE